jgi:hypothetical protein
MAGDQAVLVPVVLGAGLFFSLATLARDLVHRARGHRWLDRRRLIEGRASAALVLHGPDPASSERTGVRRRGTYLAVATVCLGLSIYTVRGSWGNFVGWTWWAEGISWLFCLMLAAGAGFGAGALVSLSLAVRPTRPPNWTRPLLARSPLGVVPAAAVGEGPDKGRRRGRAGSRRAAETS